MSTTVVCPSGASLVVRSIRGKQLKVFSDRKALKDGTFLDQLLNSCVEKVLDPGPYKLREDGLLNWDDVLSGDRTFLIIQIRVATFGNELEFSAVCVEKCQKKSGYSVDVTALPAKNLTPDDLAAFAAGNRLTAKFPGTGADVVFRLSTGADEKRVLRQTSKQDDAVLNMLIQRIYSIEGVERVKTYLEEASLGDIMALAKNMNKRDCGVDNAIALPCPDCETVNELNVPLGLAFLLPQQK